MKRDRSGTVLNKTALVLAGGGSRGSYELGVWQALRELNIEIHMVTGTSIGAINGALIAQGDFEAAQRLWNTIETSSVVDIPINEADPLKQKVKETYQNFLVNFIKQGGTEINSLKETLSTVLQEERVRASPVNYGLVTVEMEKRIPHELFIADIPKGKMIDYILASASIYPAFKPHVIDDIRFLDGAYYDNLPGKMAIEKGATRVIAVHLDAFGVVKKENLALAQETTYIQSYWDLGPSLVFDRATMQKNIRLGYLDTMKVYEKFEGHAYTFTLGFSKEILVELAKCLPLEQLLRKNGTGILDQLYISGIQKVFKERGVPEPTDRQIALVCAEIAGEIFDMDSTVVYSYKQWQEELQEKVKGGPHQDWPMEGTSEFFLALRENTQILVERRARARFAGEVITEILEGNLVKRPVASRIVVPEVFLAGVYLAAMKMV